MTQGEKIFNDKAAYHKWLKQLTDSEKLLVIEMLNEASDDGYNTGYNEATSEAISEIDKNYQPQTL